MRGAPSPCICPISLLWRNKPIVELAKHDLRLFLSDRWQTETGHVPNVEWALEGETPPLFARAAWQVYESDGDGVGGELDIRKVRG